MTYQEVNFDGLIGPSHNYAGLSFGNRASAQNAGDISNPRAAALQGLEKMRTLMELGVCQGFLPPLMRPDFRTLHDLGFRGDRARVLAQAAKEAPNILAAVFSASSMWTANAATIAPSPDTTDGRVHITPANLAGNVHRAIEAGHTAHNLKQIFFSNAHFVHHAPLPGGVHFGDEGAANHGRLARRHGDKGVHLFVYGEDGDRYPARQKRHASQAVARLHGLARDNIVFLRQAKTALDAGAFHNDVVGVANENVLFLHEASFEDRAGALHAIRAAAPDVEIVEAQSAAVGLEDAIGSYLFNSQLVCLPGGPMALIAPIEAAENPRTRAFLDSVAGDDNPIDRIIYQDVRESMRNGGGPACLRLRVVLSDTERNAVHPSFILDKAKHERLTRWVKDHYRDRVHVDDLADPEFALEIETATAALYEALGITPFSRTD